jgi:GNAT superfamily N-acetyltransferase
VTAWRQAWSLEDAEIVRQLRNAGRDWFGDAHAITSDEQRAWWEAHKDEIRCILVGDPPVGYGMLVRREDRFWVSLAVSPEARGLGWGRKIYEVLAQIAGDEPIYAGIRRDNVASRRAAEHAGFTPVAVDPPGVELACREDWIVLRYSRVR